MSSTRPLRADAERNRTALLAAAGDVIAEKGIDCAAQEIARRAGVGVGTLYRHFPTKQDLVEAVLEDRVSTLLADVAEAAVNDDAAVAFERVMYVLVARQARDRGFKDAARGEIVSSPRLMEFRAQLLDALAPVLARAQDAGHVRADVAATDLTGLAHLLTPPPYGVVAHHPRQWERFLQIALDGLRAEGARRLPAVPPPPS